MRGIHQGSLVPIDDVAVVCGALLQPAGNEKDLNGLTSAKSDGKGRRNVKHVLPCTAGMGGRQSLSAVGEQAVALHWQASHATGNVRVTRPVLER